LRCFDQRRSATWNRARGGLSLLMVNESWTEKNAAKQKPGRPVAKQTQKTHRVLAMTFAIPARRFLKTFLGQSR
jgi:hypothetical protein